MCVLVEGDRVVRTEKSRHWVFPPRARLPSCPSPRIVGDKREGRVGGTRRRTLVGPTKRGSREPSFTRVVGAVVSTGLLGFCTFPRGSGREEDKPRRSLCPSTLLSYRTLSCRTLWECFGVDTPFPCCPPPVSFPQVQCG